MSIFKLQQFSIKQQANAMKVCTDSLVFGALTPVNGARHVLDVGTGTGLLSLMAMQRGAKRVSCVELIKASAQEAQYNFSQSAWDNQITLYQQDFNSFVSDVKFDVIISNPPFFDNHLKNPNSVKQTARHTDTLSYQQLLSRCRDLLTPKGVICLLLPYHAQTELTAIATGLSLYISKRTDFLSMAGSEPKVALFELQHSTALAMPPAITSNSLIIFSAHQQYTDESARLLANFLLRFKPSPENANDSIDME